MNIVVVNCSGNVGKTTLTRQLLAPRLPGHSVAMMESINADDGGGEAVDIIFAREASRIHDRMLAGEKLIVDVGASNVEEYLGWLGTAKGAHQDFGLFVVPVVPAIKQMRDTFKTVIMLGELGVTADRIRVVFNMVDRPLQEPLERTLRRDFAEILAFQADTQAFPLRLDAAVPQSDVFALSAEIGRTVYDISRDTTEYREKIAAEPPGPRRNELVKLEGLRRLARGMEPHLQSVFDVVLRTEPVQEAAES